MPIYVYTCKTCGISIEKLESSKAPEVQPCEVCKDTSGLERKIAPSSFTLTGSGWYKDSYIRK